MHNNCSGFVMYQKTVEKEGYSKADLKRLKAIGKRIGVLQKRPGFRNAVKKFIELTT